MQGFGITKLVSLGRKQALSPEQIPWGQGSYLVSQPSEIFIAGFYPVGFNAYAFAIWYACSNTTIVWMANRDNPVNGWESSLTFRKDGNLVLTDANKTLVWESKTGKSDRVAELVLRDTGNLVLLNKNGNTVWESFQHPTDTLLPRQSVERNTELRSRFSHSSYTTGYYRLFFDSDNVLSLSFDGTGNLVVYWPDPDLIAYSSGRSHYGSTRTATMDERGNFQSSDGYTFNTTDYGETPLRRLTLDPDGNLRAYSWDSYSSEWNIVWEAFTQLCKIQGLCGNNGICIETPKPHCGCLSGFRMVNSSNWLEGCEPIHSLKPQEYCSSDKIKLLSLEHADFYGNDLDTYNAYRTLEQCREICMTDCRCKAFAYRLDGMGKCFPKGSLFNGIQSPTSPGTVYIKVSSAFPYNSSKDAVLHSFSLTCPPPDLTGIQRHRPAKPNRHRLWNIPVGILISIAVLEVACFGMGWWYLFKR